MSATEKLSLTLDGRQIEARAGQTILEAAVDAGVYVPRLCWMEGLKPAGACRLCTVKVNGRFQSACTRPVAEGLTVENDTEELRALRRDLLDLLFVEGNHFCMFCEKSGACELQAQAYRHGITAPRFPFQNPRREVDATHPDLLLDRHRCILCGRCVRASEELDRKSVFAFVGRGSDRRLAVEPGTLGASDASAEDRAVAACPTGALLRKRTAYRTPVGQRPFDRQPIGSESRPRREQP